MGVTLSHTILAPISLASTIIGFISFAFTLATFFNVFWSSLQTIYAAPSEMTDHLSSLKQGLIEQRRHLRKVRKRMRSAKRERSDGPDYGGGDGSGEQGGRRRYNRGRRYGKGRHSMQFERDEQAFRSQGEKESLRVIRIGLRDMIRSFRRIEYPFLKPEYQDTDSAHWSTNTPASEKYPHFNQTPLAADEDNSDSGLGRTHRFGNEYRACGLRERWLWLKRKPDIISMSEGLARMETRRISHEVGEVFNMALDIGRDLEDVRAGIGSLEGRMSRVVGIRRVD